MKNLKEAASPLVSTLKHEKNTIINMIKNKIELIRTT